MLPFSTSTFTILRSDADPATDGYADTAANWPEQEEGIRGHISRPSFAEVRAGSVQTLDVMSIALDPCDIRVNDRVQDERDLQVYELVGSPMQRIGFGLEHVNAQIRLVTGYIG
jgi:hypothetical protein